MDQRDDKYFSKKQISIFTVGISNEPTQAICAINDNGCTARVEADQCNQIKR